MKNEASAMQSPANAVQKAQRLWQEAKIAADRQVAVAPLLALAQVQQNPDACWALYQLAQGDPVAWSSLAGAKPAANFLDRALLLGSAHAFEAVARGQVLQDLPLLPKLCILAVGMRLRALQNTPVQAVMKSTFENLSQGLGADITRDVLASAEGWRAGSLPGDARFLNGRLLNHGATYPKADPAPPNRIFRVSLDLDEYLHRLPGAKAYFDADEALREGRLVQWRESLRAAAQAHNGAAIYATEGWKHPSWAEWDKRMLVRAAEGGSIDALEDLVDKLAVQLRDEMNSHARAELALRRRATGSRLSLVEQSLLFLSCVADRLGILALMHSTIPVHALSDQAVEGFSVAQASLADYTYRVAAKEQVLRARQRTQKWRFGDSFEPEIYTNFSKLGLL